MSEENTGVDPLGLSMDLSNVDTSRPCLPEGTQLLSIKSVAKEANKAGTGSNLKVEFATVNDSMDSTGARLLAAGFVVTKWYPLQQSDNEKAPPFEADLARLQDAAEGTKQGDRPLFNPFNYTGRLVLGKLKIKSDDQFGNSNEIAKLEYVTA